MFKISVTTQGIEQLIDKCGMHSHEWRFNFGLNKTKYIWLLVTNMFREIPEWHLNGFV